MNLTLKFLHQGHAEDVILWHRYHYYIVGVPLIPDVEYDRLEKLVAELFPVSVVQDVGSSNAEDYPLYIREGRRPDFGERVIRDAAIAQRWMDSL